MEQLGNETYYQFAVRCTKAVEDRLIGYSEWGDSLLGSLNTYTEDNNRKQFYFVQKMLPNLLSTDKFSQDDVINEIERQKDEIIKEKIKARDQRRELSKIITSEARFDNLKEAMVEAIDNMPEMKLKHKQYYDSTIRLKEGVAMLSDIHYGMGCDNPSNFYDPEVAKERLTEYTDKIIYYCLSHNVTKLHFVVLGDCISGFIHNSVRVQQMEDCMEQLMEISEIIANMVVKIQQHIPEVVVYSTYGNHARTQSSKMDAIDRENLERLIPWYLRARLGKEFKIIDSGNVDYVQFKVAGKTVIATHGDKDSISTALNNVVRTIGIIPDQILIGHRHHVSFEDDCDVEIIANGSVVGTDDYAIKVRKVTKPSQTLLIYDKDVIMCKINLEK